MQLTLHAADPHALRAALRLEDATPVRPKLGMDSSQPCWRDQSSPDSPGNRKEPFRPVRDWLLGSARLVVVPFAFTGR